MREVINPMDVKDKLENNDELIAVIDIRGDLPYSEGHISGCTHIPRRELEFELPIVVPNRSINVVIYDQNGERAGLDVEWLRYLGYTNAQYLEGGYEAWKDCGFDITSAADGVPRTAFNVPSKEFGEKVQVTKDVPQISPEELKEKKEQEDVIITDVRTPPEYKSGTIPDSMNVGGLDLPLYIENIKNDKEDGEVIVHCAGRTRSIMGAATMRELGFEDVYELENGTMGWKLAGFELEEEADREVNRLYPMDDHGAVDPDSIEELKAKENIGTMSIEEFTDTISNQDENHAIYLIDVRSSKEFEDNHIPKSISIPGGQAIQTANEHIAVDNAEIVFISDTETRATLAAYWFSKMGFPNVSVLKGGLNSYESEGYRLESGDDEFEPLVVDTVDEITDPIDPNSLSDPTDTAVVHVGYSENYIEEHIPGSKWVSRNDLEEHISNDSETILSCETGNYSKFAEASIKTLLDEDNIRALKNGVKGWEEAGRKIESGKAKLDNNPRDKVDRPYHQGEQAMRAYLEWETELGEKYE